MNNASSVINFENTNQPISNTESTNNVSVKSLINMDKDEYENYIEHAINVIKWRTEKIE